MSQDDDDASAGESTHAGFELLRKCHPSITEKEVNRVESGPARVHVKLPRSDGSVPAEPYFAQVQLAAWQAGWSKEDSAGQLALALEVLLDLTEQSRETKRLLQGHLNSGSGHGRQESKDGSNWPADGVKKGRVWVLCPPMCSSMCSEDTHSAPQLHRRSWISTHSCKPCKTACSIIWPRNPDSSTGRGKEGGEGALLDGTHVTVVGRWGIWPVIVPSLHPCPESLRFRKTRSERSGGAMASPTTVYTPPWEMFIGRSQTGFVNLLCSKRACQQSPH